MTGASKEDYKSYLEFPEKIHVNIWTCHQNTKRENSKTVRRVMEL